VLIIDADEELEYMDSKFYEKLDVNYTYVIDKHHVGHTYAVPYLINIKKGQWQWHAPVHNYIGDKNCIPAKKLNDVWILYHEGEGAKSHGVTRQEKYLRDAVVLEKELEKNPNDARSRFYLAQSYMDADAWDKAIKNFKDVLGMNGWIEEQYVACWRISQILMRNNAPVREIVGWVAQAQELLPRRLEALYGFVSWCRKKEKYALGYLLGRIGTSIAAPEKFSLYINPEIYKWEFLDELSICAYWVGDYVLSQELAEKVLEKMPEDGTQWWVGERGRVANNLKYALQKLADVKV
jgi:tetratricopeptide (TPR) repeat protein